LGNLEWGKGETELSTITFENIADQIQDRKTFEEHMRQQGRLSPGQALTCKFPVLHYGSIPSFKLDQWNFRIFREVTKELCLTWQEFCQIPRKAIQFDIHCVTSWSNFCTNWKGVSLHTLLDSGLLEIKPIAKHILSMLKKIIHLTYP